jgi:putative hydroxymethylpyrimidine transport system substrate-binding protein
MLKTDGVEGGLDEVELVNVGFNLAEALINGSVDACVGCYISHESFLMENQGYPVNIMRMEEWGVPDFYELVMVTSEKMLKEKPELVQRFIRAVVRGYRDAAADPEAAVDILLKGTDEEVEEAIERPGVLLLAPLWKDGVSVGWQTPERWVAFADWLYANGQLDEPIDGTQAYTNEFVERAN